MTRYKDYTKLRAPEDVALRQGLHPIRIFALLFPVHEVEVRATTRTGRPYGLIDKFLERAIGEGAITTVPGLADFLGLDEVLVDRAVRVLRSIGHLPPHSDTLELTSLAWESLRDGTCYEIRKQDRRKLYFDAYRCEPLHSRHYGSATTFLNLAEAQSRSHAGEFQLLHSGHQFRRAALDALGRHPRREEYNLPLSVEDPLDAQPNYVFLPIYVVHAVARGGHVRYLVYPEGGGGEVDEGLSDLCSDEPEIVRTLENEAVSVAGQEQRIKRWLANQHLSGRTPVRHPDGSWQVDLEPGDFDPPGPRKVSGVGSFVDLRTVLVRLWCEDADVRRRALLARAEMMLHRARYRPAEFPAMLRRLGDQLEFPDLDADRLRALAREAGHNTLADQLDQLSADPGV